jgi:hypothetical protein
MGAVCLVNVISVASRLFGQVPGFDGWAGLLIPVRSDFPGWVDPNNVGFVATDDGLSSLGWLDID